MVGYNYGNEVKDSFSTGSVRGDKFIGGLAGCNIGIAIMMKGTPYFIYSKIENSYATGAVTGDGASRETGVGGLVGYNHVFAKVQNSYATGAVSGKQNTGGLVGHNNLGTIENCYTTSNVEGTSYIGGLVGLHQKNLAGGIPTTTHGAIIVRNCIAYNNEVTSSLKEDIGKVVGHTSGEEAVVNCCYAKTDMNITEQGDDSQSGEGLTIAQFKDIDFYKNIENWDTENGGSVWDFDHVWIMGKNAPLLRNKEESSGDVSHKKKHHSKRSTMILPLSSKNIKDIKNIDIKKNSIISEDFFDLVKNGKEVKFKGNFYTIAFTGDEEMSAVDGNSIDLGATVITSDDETRRAFTGGHTVHIRFNHKGKLPSTAKITVDLKENKNNKVYVYAYDQETKELKITGLFMTDCGNVTFEVNQGGDYILSECILPTKEIYKDDIEGIGYLKGYSNDTFGPNDKITRAQTAMMLSNLFKESKFMHEKTFSDINMWAKKAILNVEGLGYVSGYSDGTFRPNNTITRAEFVKIIVNVFDVKDVQSYKEVAFTDINNSWAKKEIEICYKLEIVSGNYNEFRPNDTITRAEAVTIINKLINRKSVEKENPFHDLSKKHWAYDEIVSAVEE